MPPGNVLGGWTARSADSGVFHNGSSIGFHGQLVLLIDLEILQVKKIASLQILLSTTDLTIEFSMPFSKANQQWKEFENDENVLVIFLSPVNSCISSW